MRVLDGQNRNPVVLENLGDFRRGQIAAMKDSLGIHRTAFIDFSNFDIGFGERDGRVHHGGSAVRPINRGFSRGLRCRPFEGKKCGDVRRVVIVKVRDEDVGDRAKSQSGLNGRFESAIPTVDEIRPAIDDHGIGGLGPVGGDARAALRAQQNQLRSCLRSRLSSLPTPRLPKSRYHPRYSCRRFQ